MYGFACSPLEFALSRVLDPLESVQKQLPRRARVHGAVDARNVSQRGAHSLSSLIQDVHAILERYTRRVLMLRWKAKFEWKLVKKGEI